jgi:hypothetical protein
MMQCRERGLVLLADSPEGSRDFRARRNNGHGGHNNL